MLADLVFFDVELLLRINSLFRRISSEESGTLCYTPLKSTPPMHIVR